MEITIERRNLYRILLCLGTGLGAGFVNGLSGTGAGVVFLLMFGLFGGGISKAVFSVSMACVIPLSLVSLVTYPPPSSEILAMLPWIFGASVTGGLFGAWIQRHVRVQVLKWAFAVLVIWAGLRMMF